MELALRNLLLLIFFILQQHTGVPIMELDHSILSKNLSAFLEHDTFFTVLLLKRPGRINREYSEVEIHELKR